MVRFARLAAGSLAALSMMAGTTSDVVAQDKKGGGSDVETCTTPYGTIAINEPHEQTWIWLRSYQLGSPSSLLRTIAQKSNCFVVVERGVGMQNMKQEREFAASGELQEGQNIGKGQMVAADYMMTPAIQGTDNNAGGAGGGMRLPGRLGGVIGGVKKKEAQTSITVASVRTGVQVAAAEGAATKRDFAIGGFGLGVGGGGYTSTSEGKMVAASLLDNFNKVIVSIKSNASIRPMSADRLAKLTGGGDEPTAGKANEGAIMSPKIDGVKIMRTASDTAAVISTLKRGDDVVFLGEESGGFVKVQGASGEGWVKKMLMNTKQ
jgi:curli biogenesis system outer membrane secretion channel CsgG